MPHKESNQGHWGGLKANPHQHLGFIYLIEDVTAGRKYIGRKNYWLKKSGAKGCKTAIADKTSEKWKPSCWKESSWRTYKGSSPSFQKWQEKYPEHEYSYTILRQCRNRSEIHYGEVEELVLRGAMWKTVVPIEGEEDSWDSNYEYFNRLIPSTKFRIKTWEGLLESESD
jgi:hypothetical protein